MVDPDHFSEAVNMSMDAHLTDVQRALGRATWLDKYMDRISAASSNALKSLGVVKTGKYLAHVKCILM